MKTCRATHPLLLLREGGDDCRHVGGPVVVLVVVGHRAVQVRVLLPDLVEPAEGGKSESSSRRRCWTGPASLRKGWWDFYYLSIQLPMPPAERYAYAPGNPLNLMAQLS